MTELKVVLKTVPRALAQLVEDYLAQDHPPRLRLPAAGGLPALVRRPLDH
ncbi:MAG TPA: hypothetical protein VNG93_13850 [Candidatus Dormibacteraeota bacterium]|nr:hypothetical protein [Candidatus Dormibacteraeota bacterium]